MTKLYKDITYIDSTFLDKGGGDNSDMIGMMMIFQYINFIVKIMHALKSLLWQFSDILLKEDALCMH